MTQEIAVMVMPGAITSIITLVIVKKMARKNNLTDFSGVFWGMVLAILFGTIVNMIVLIAYIHHIKIIG